MFNVFGSVTECTENDRFTRVPSFKKRQPIEDYRPTGYLRQPSSVGRPRSLSSGYWLAENFPGFVCTGKIFI